MAIQSITYVTGKIGNVVFYKVFGKYVARSRPVKVRQTEAAKIRSHNFGTAARAGKTLRALLAPALPFAKDKSMQSRFGGAITKWLGQSDPAAVEATDNIPYVKGFQFNELTSVAERWKVDIISTQPAENLIEVHIPGFVPVDAISAPAHTKEIKCMLAAAVCKLENGEAIGSNNASIVIPYDDAWCSGRIVQLPVEISKGTMVVVIASLKYYLKDGVVIKPAFMPATVIHAGFA